MSNVEIGEDLRKSIFTIYLNKLAHRQIIDNQLIQYIYQSSSQRQIVLETLEQLIELCPNGPSNNTPNTEKQQNIISNVSVNGEIKIVNGVTIENQIKGKKSWEERNYVKDKKVNVIHVRIAYFINRQIAEQRNLDPLEYFEQYRRSGNE